MVTGDSAMSTGTTMSRMEKRKLLKKEKRKQLRKEIALKEKEEEDARLNDIEEQTKLKKLELEELDRMERDRREFEERERNFLEELELKRKREQEEYEQEQVRQKLAQESRAKQAQEENSKEMDEGSDWEYVEEGPAEIIWQGNEIIVKKKRVKVPKKKNSEQQNKKDVVRPISNPLAPQSEVFEEYKSAKEVLDCVAQQVPNFGTEQDKDHCPFHLKTGACRFGPRCSRVHFYPDKSCTLLMKNMYGGPGLVWEQDEGLEHTDEEIQKSFEEFYEDVHTEFLKFGEIVNFKVCRNGSPHLRGNVYVHYKSIESAVLAYQSTNGRYFAAKQVICEFVNLTRWKVAICGEYMKSRLKRCSRGSACNFIHCFRNPGGDYEWADWDRPPPRYWITKLAALFGYEDEYENLINEVNPDEGRISTSLRMDADRHHSRSRSRDPGSRNTRSYDDNDYRKSKEKQSRYIRKGRETSLDRGKNKEKMRGKDKSVYSDDDQSDRESRRINHEGYYAHKRSHRRSRWRSKDRCSESNSDRDDNSAKDVRERYREEYKSHRSGWHSYGKSAESDSDRERSIKDGRKRYREDKAEETHQNNSEGRYHEYRRKSSKHEVSDLDTSSSDSHGDTVVKNKDSFDKYENDYYRQRKESSNPETVIKRTELSEHTSSHSRRNKDEKRESSKHRKGEKSQHKSRRRSSRHRNDQNKVDVQVVTEMHDAEKHVRFEAAESDEGNEHLSRQEDSVELEIENEEACRRVALEKLQEKQLQKQLSMKSSNCNVEESVTTTKVNEDQNDIEAEPGKRRRI